MHKLFRIKRFVTALSLIAVLLSACSSNAKSALPTPTRLPLSVEEQNKADYIDEYYTQLAQEGMFSGSVLVEMDGKIIIDKGYGYADRVNEIPNTIQTRFRIFNASKVFTAIGVMVLVDQGALSVSDPICKYLNDCPSHWGELTVEVLLNGSSGLPDYTLMTPIEKTWDKPISRDDL